MGAIPPLSQADWQEAFAKYQQIPQYQHVNRGMSLDAFKAHLLVGMGAPLARPPDRRGLPRAVHLFLGDAARIRALLPKAWRASSRLAACRVRSAGTW